MKAFLLLLLFSTPALAGEVSFALGPDIVHAKGLRIWTVAVENENSRFRYGRIGQQGHEVQLFAAEYVWHPTARLSPSLGIGHLDFETPWTGTLWNFILGVRYRVSKDVFIGYVHVSHGRGLGIARDKTNNGFNFITVGTLF